jgi:hypothetical protein
MIRQSVSDERGYKSEILNKLNILDTYGAVHHNKR